jgi:hypothetical protein
MNVQNPPRGGRTQTEICEQAPTDKALQGWTCELLPASQCKPIAQGGVCQRGPLSNFELKEELKKASGEAVSSIGKAPPPPTPAIIPKLNTPIPGFAFTGAENITPETSSLLAQYIAAAYRYGISITAIAATVMFVYGAFQYLVGSAIPSVNQGKTIMQEAVLGMLLVFGANMILRTLNPATLSLEVLKITTIKTERALSDIPIDAYIALTGKAPPSKQEMLTLAQEKGASTGIPELGCIMRASMAHESGGNAAVIGHDENHQATFARIPSRQAFLKSGEKYSGEKFPAVQCNDPSCQTANVKNNDDVTFDPRTPPDYGLDWRFSHGIGATQSTIFPNSKPCQGEEAAGRGYRTNKGCYTLPELLTPEGSLQAMFDFYSDCWKKYPTDPARVFTCYGGGDLSVDNEIIVGRVKTYERCLGTL